MGELGTAGWVIVILACVIVVEAAVLGIWLWARGRQLQALAQQACELRADIAGLERNIAMRAEQARLEGQSNAEALADFDNLDPTVLDG